MGRMSYCFLCTVNIVTLLITALIVWRRRPFMTGFLRAGCASFLEVAIFSLVSSLLIVSVVELMALFCRLGCLHRVYLFMMGLIILVEFGFVSYSLMVTVKGPPKEISGREYRVDEFSGLLRKTWVDRRNWMKISSCLVDKGVCDGFEYYFVVLPASAVWQITNPVESGCCRPPGKCGYLLKKNTSNWEVPKGGLRSKDDDCFSWRNDPQTLCFNCEACKAGFLAQVRDDWMGLNVFTIFLLIFLVIVLAVGFLHLRSYPSSSNVSSSSSPSSSSSSSLP